MLEVQYRLNDNPDYTYFHSHDAYEIFMFHKGACMYLINNHIYDLQPGDILLMDGLALHKPNTIKDSEYIRSHIHFKPEDIEPILSSIKANGLLDVFKYQHHYLLRTNNTSKLQYIEELIKKLYQIRLVSNVTELEKAWEMKLILGQVLIQINQILKDSHLNISRSSTSKTSHAEKIATYIQHHYREQFTIADMAKSINLDKSYISKVFKEATGFTIMEYVMACRIKQVKYLLETKEKKSIQQIAFECGFCNMSHFSRYFKKQVGITPRAYRQKRLDLYRKTRTLKLFNSEIKRE